MSHFAVIVVIQDRVMPEQILDRIDQEMAPFMENCCAEPDRMYMKFFDTEDEMMKEYEEGSQEYIVMPDGRLLLPWDEEFRVKDPKDPMGFMTKNEPPAELERRVVPFKEKFPTFDEYVQSWHGREERDETMKRYGYWQNPNAKWDWYEVGGRWAGYFQLKNGRRGGKGSQYNFTGRLEATGDKADICLKDAVDFEAMRNEYEVRAIKRYDLVWGAIEGTQEPEPWEHIREKFKDDIDEARKQYHDQSRVKAFQELCNSEEGREIFGFFASVEEYQVPREQYIQNARNNAAVPFAILKDGKWYEQGKMGWWGIATNEKDPETWNSMVAKLMDDLPGDTILAACDCHI